MYQRFIIWNLAQILILLLPVYAEAQSKAEPSVGDGTQELTGEKEPQAQLPHLTDVAQRNPTTSGVAKSAFIKSEDGKFKMAISGRMQVRGTYANSLRGDERVHESNFALERSRIGLSGHAYKKELAYKVQLAWDKGSVGLKDYFFDFELSPYLFLRAGQYKKPFSRQFIASSGKIKFVARAITHEKFGIGRDVGVMLHNGLTRKNGVEYAVGLFNGTGEIGQLRGAVEVDPVTGIGNITDGSISNVPDVMEPLLVARIGYSSSNLKGYEETDFVRGATRWGVSAAGQFAFDADNDDSSLCSFQLDAIAKRNGVSANAAVYAGFQQAGSSAFKRRLQEIGAHLEVGYLAWVKTEVALRYGFYSPRAEQTHTHELAAGVSYFWRKHSLKLTTDAVAYLNREVLANTHDLQIRTQAQFSF